MTAADLQRLAPSAPLASGYRFELLERGAVRSLIAALPYFHRSRFMVYASRAMRGSVIDYVRRRRARKRGGEFEIVSLHSNLPEAETDDGLVAQLSGALDALEKVDQRLAECVDLEFFCGFSFTEIARMFEVSERTVQRDWHKARVLLNRLMNDQDEFVAA